jgi:hypothetical protein
MKVCDDKITKLKERIKSELPVYSREQINRSREVTLECVLSLGPRVSGDITDTHQHVFKSPPKGDALRQVFQDQTERAILRSKQLSNRPKLQVPKAQTLPPKVSTVEPPNVDSGVMEKAKSKAISNEKKCSSGKCELLTKSDVGEGRVVSPKNPPILPRNLAQEGFEEPTKEKEEVGVLFNFILRIH